MAYRNLCLWGLALWISISCTAIDQSDDRNGAASAQAVASSKTPVRLVAAMVASESAGASMHGHLGGTIEILNTAYEKSVSVHYRTRESGDWRDSPAVFLRSLDTNRELWFFRTPEAFAYVGSAVGYEFAIRCDAAPKTSWDNNGGRNYKVSAGARPYYPKVALGSANLALIGAWTDGALAKGEIALRNLAYQKEVNVVYSQDGWNTTLTAPARFSGFGSGYLDIAANSDTEYWTFELPLRDGTRRVDFAISYRVKGKEYWDNAAGLNYTLAVPGTLSGGNLLGRSPSGSLLAASGGLSGVQFGPGGRATYLAEFDSSTYRGTLNVYDPADGTSKAVGTDVSLYSAVVFSPDGRRLAFATGQAMPPDFASELRLYDFTTREISVVATGVQTSFGYCWQPGNKCVSSVAFSPNGDRLFYTAPAGVFILNFETGVDLQIPGANDNNFRGLSPDWTVALYVRDADTSSYPSLGTLVLYDLQTEETFELATRTDGNFTFHNEDLSTWIAMSNYDAATDGGDLVVWRRASGSQTIVTGVRRSSIHVADDLSRVAFVQGYAEAKDAGRLAIYDLVNNSTLITKFDVPRYFQLAANWSQVSFLRSVVPEKQTGDLYVRRVDTKPGLAKRIATNVYEGDVRLSPDGSKVLYLEDFAAATGNGNLFLYDTARRTVALLGKAVRSNGESVSSFYTEANWSLLLFASDVDFEAQKGALWKYDFATGAKTLIEPFLRVDWSFLQSHYYPPAADDPNVNDIFAGNNTFRFSKERRRAIYATAPHADGTGAEVRALDLETGTTQTVETGLAYIEGLGIVDDDHILAVGRDAPYEQPKLVYAGSAAGPFTLAVEPDAFSFARTEDGTKLIVKANRNYSAQTMDIVVFNLLTEQLTVAAQGVLANVWNNFVFLREADMLVMSSYGAPGFDKLPGQRKLFTYDLESDGPPTLVEPWVSEFYASKEGILYARGKAALAAPLFW